MANWHKMLIEYDSNGNPIYIGLAQEMSKRENQEGWYIKRFTWDSSGNMVEKLKRVGKWSERTEGW